MSGEPLPHGTEVQPWGSICGVTNRGGERFYFLMDRRGTVALMPEATLLNALKEVPSA